MDVRVPCAWFEGILEDNAVGQRGQGALWLEQAPSLQLPGLAAAVAFALGSRHYATGKAMILVIYVAFRE